MSDLRLADDPRPNRRCTYRISRGSDRQFAAIWFFRTIQPTTRRARFGTEWSIRGRLAVIYCAGLRRCHHGGQFRQIAKPSRRRSRRWTQRRRLFGVRRWRGDRSVAHEADRGRPRSPYCAGAGRLELGRVRRGHSIPWPCDDHGGQRRHRHSRTDARGWVRQARPQTWADLRQSAGGRNRDGGRPIVDGKRDRKCGPVLGHYAAAAATSGSSRLSNTGFFLWVRCFWRDPCCTPTIMRVRRCGSITRLQAGLRTS